MARSSHFFLGFFSLSHFFFNNSKGRFPATVSYIDYEDILSGRQKEYKPLQKIMPTTISFTYQKNDSTYDELK